MIEDMMVGSNVQTLLCLNVIAHHQNHRAVRAVILLPRYCLSYCTIFDSRVETQMLLRYCLATKIRDSGRKVILCL